MLINMKLNVFILFCILHSIAGGLIPSANVDSYIVGGKNASDGQAPYQCSLEYKGKHNCGCVIISDQWLLTCAHCLGSGIKDATVLVGTNDLESGGVRYTPRKYIKHERFNESPLSHDVGLLQIDQIEFSEKVQPIKFTSNYVQAGAELQAFGWGRLNTTGPMSQFLQTVKLTAITHDECKSKVYMIAICVHLQKKAKESSIKISVTNFGGKILINNMNLKVFILFCVLNSISGGSIPNVNVGYHDPFIVGGENARDGQAPYQCSIQKNGRHFCGCAIINEQWILTAAHCIVSGMWNYATVLVGTNDLKSGGVRYEVQEHIVHEEYQSPSRYAHDIGLVRVEKMKFTKKVQPIKYTSNYVESGAALKIFGWGMLGESSSYPEVLQTINTTALSQDECKKNVNIIHDSHLCTFTKKGEGACFGDSGGSLVLGDELVGLVNFGIPCAVGYPDGFARISYFYDWIESKINPST
ncbi:chymotrypsin-1-like [Contarinia nasturtii]|uniref:chymotrypsin-1-like n=1 Tax=Contarinia nasturtii TaxID=265458 RepID=UPI0012D4BA53|nr:chymotrypsin-1-like [Contarinia nasturtii]